MAERAAEYLRAHPDETMVVLAGSGHLAYGSGIPRRLTRRLDVKSAIVLSDWEGAVEPGLADYLLLPREQALPPAGKFGALLDEQDDGLRIEQCLPGSPCKLAGLRPGDQIIAVNGVAVTRLADLRVATWDKRPGDSVTLEIRRRRWFRAPEDLSYEITLR
jgi:S1-C subfamily serine protease